MYNHASLAHWMENKDIMDIIPTNVDIDLTNNCNQDCYYCISADFREAYNKTDITYEHFMKLIQQLATWRKHTPNSYGTLHAITFSGGGEPTLLKNYERVIESSIDSGFLTSLTTNGVLLNKLIDNVPSEKLVKMNWVGIDIDAGTEDVYEKIRKSKTIGMFGIVVKNATTLVKLNVPVDFKVLANEYNTNAEQIRDVFSLAKRIGIRLVYYRPTILHNNIFDINPEITELIKKYSNEFGVQYKLNISKSITRNYSRCYQMFQFPNFCADGNVYTCCDNKGDHKFSIGSWLDSDFRDLWLGDRHWEVYNSINTNLCPPCRPNKNNIEIQNCINDRGKIGILNT
jgi:sulfatase maturation enzyme AslB (radical SAM superfamily)